MSTDPRIEAAAAAVLASWTDEKEYGLPYEIAAVALAAADAVHPLRNLTDADIERAAFPLDPLAFRGKAHDPDYQVFRDRAKATARAVVAALRGGEA